MRTVIVLALFVAACDTTCKKTDFEGLYKFEPKLLTGDCGEMASGKIVLDGGGIGNAGDGGDCTTSLMHMSEDRCVMESAMECYFSGEGFVNTHFLAEDMEPDGSSIEGTLSIDIRNVSGSAVCSGTYTVTYTRE